MVRAAAVAVAAVGDAVAGHAGCGTIWRSLLLETVHLLRHANRSVSEGAKESLTALHGRSVSLQSLTPLLEDLLGGPRGRGEGAAFNTVRVVLWLTELADREMGPSSGQARASVTAETSGDIARVFPRVDASLAVQRCKPLLQHREEATRDAAMGLMARLLAIDIMQQFQPQNGSDTGPSPTLRAALEENTSSECTDVTPEGIRRLVSAPCKAAVEALSNANNGVVQAPPTVDPAAARKVSRLLAETTRLLRLREGLPVADRLTEGSTSSQLSAHYPLKKSFTTSSTLASRGAIAGRKAPMTREDPSLSAGASAAPGSTTPVFSATQPLLSQYQPGLPGNALSTAALKRSAPSTSVPNNNTSTPSAGKASRAKLSSRPITPSSRRLGISSQADPESVTAVDASNIEPPVGGDADDILCGTEEPLRSNDNLLTEQIMVHWDRLRSALVSITPSAESAESREEATPDSDGFADACKLVLIVIELFRYK